MLVDTSKQSPLHYYQACPLLSTHNNVFFRLSLGHSSSLRIPLCQYPLHRFLLFSEVPAVAVVSYLTLPYNYPRLPSAPYLYFSFPGLQMAQYPFLPFSKLSCSSLLFCAPHQGAPQSLFHYYSLLPTTPYGSLPLFFFPRPPYVSIPISTLQ